MDKVVFSVESKVIRDTLEYVFIGKDKFVLEIVPGIRTGIPFVDNKASIVVCECTFADEDALNKACTKLTALRRQLDDNIPLIIFSENPDELGGKIRVPKGIVRTVTLDNFFLDNLFGVMQEELFSDCIACYM